MLPVDDLVSLALRQTANATTMTLDGDTVQPACNAGNAFDGRIAVRVSSIFVILVGSTFGALFPTYAQREGWGLPKWTFFIAKYFGSGVIIATAFIHLLAPATDALTDPCLTGPITEYDWAEGIALMMVFLLFFIELMTIRYSNFSLGQVPTVEPKDSSTESCEIAKGAQRGGSHIPGEDHLGHSREHVDNGVDDIDGQQKEHYATQITAVFILEFGVIFHSIFVGLTLAIAGEEFNVLYVVLVFHQTFEGLGLGTRLADAPWPKGKRWTPYIMGAAYGLTTPIAIATGLGVRQSYAPGSQTALIVNGVFDSLSAGILLYTGLVELMAHEFMFSEQMRNEKIGVVLSAVGLMCLGAGLMALLGKWA